QRSVRTVRTAVHSRHHPAWQQPGARFSVRQCCLSDRPQRHPGRLVRAVARSGRPLSRRVALQTPPDALYRGALHPNRRQAYAPPRFLHAHLPRHPARARRKRIAAAHPAGVRRPGNHPGGAALMPLRIFRSLAEVPPDFGPSALTIGNFDGLHAGHRRILRRVRELAAARQLRPSALTFDPHPTRVVRPDRAPPLMTTCDERAALMADEGIEQVLILPFGPEIAQLSPEQFVSDILVNKLRVRVVAVGDNFRFGHRQAGNTDVLRQLGSRFGFTTEIVPAVTIRGVPVSSSEIRRLVTAGNVARAARLLERPYSLQGDVVSGHGIGHKQTVPTLNLQPTAEVLPKNGVYITCTDDLDNRRRWQSITNIGH